MPYLTFRLYDLKKRNFTKKEGCTFSIENSSPKKAAIQEVQKDPSRPSFFKTLKNHLLGPLSFFFGLFLIVALLISSIKAVVFDPSFYQNLYSKLDWANQIQVSEEDLKSSISMMVDYVQEKRDDLEGEIVWKGQRQPTFNTKEIRHMKDVRDLWLKAKMVMHFSWWGCVLCGLLVILFKKEQSILWLFEGLKASFIFLGIVLILLGFWCCIDFTGFWTWFHTIVFPGNQDWLLNPATDFMIVICPEEMFSTMILHIALRLLIRLGLIFGALYGLKRYSQRLQKLRSNP